MNTPMQYGQIVFLLFIVLLLYYAVLIALDIQKTKAAQAAEQDGQTEEEIDISDEAQTFKPVKISRDEPVKKQEASEKEEASRKDEAEEPDAQEPLDTEKPFHRPGYREAIMTDGILVEDIIHEINRLAETGTSDLGTVIFNCENAM